MPSLGLSVAVAGMCGVLFRFGADHLTERLSLHPAVGTFLVNIVGCFIAGVVYTLALSRTTTHAPWATVVIVGFCGGLTTFSSFALQAVLMFQRGQWQWLVGYAVLSPLIGFVAVFGGLQLTRVLIS